MPNLVCQYIVLEYAPAITDLHGIPYLLVILTDDGEGSSRIEVLEPMSRGPIPDGDRGYLQTLAEEWKQTPNDEAENLMERLKHLSIGPIRPGAMGTCDRSEVEDHLERAGETGLWSSSP